MTIALLIVGSLVQFFAGSLWYVRDTLRGTSKPNRMTFLIWAVGPFIGVAAGVTAGAGFALIPVFMSGLGPFLIFLASFVNPKAYWKLGVLDYVCGILAVTALCALVFVHAPIFAIMLAILADALASVPTLIKSWRYPETETGGAYVASLFNVLIGVIVAGTYTFATVGFLYYLVVCDALLVIAVYRTVFSRLFERKA